MTLNYTPTNNEVYIAIDLSTTKTGVAIRCNEEWWHKQYVFIKFNPSDIYKNIINLVNDIKNHLKQYQHQKVIMGIEISNFSNPKITQRFSLYGGAIISLIKDKIPNEVDIKIFNSNDWQLLIPNISTQTHRSERKTLSRGFISQTLKNLIKSDLNSISEDEIDALCMCYFLKDIKTTLSYEEFKRKQRKENKKQLNKLNKINQLQTKIIEEKNEKNKNKMLKKLKNML